MASARNNTVQERRAALREQQRLERAAADEVFKLLEAEENAKVATAAGIVKLVDTAGRDRAADVTGLSLRELAAYAALHAEATGSGDDAVTGDQDDVDDAPEAPVLDSVPAQSGKVPAAVPAAD